MIIDSYSESNCDDYLEMYTPSNIKISQSFTSKNARITSCKFYLKKIGNPTGSPYARLSAHSGTYGTSSVPDATLVNSNSYDIANITTSYQLIEFTFPNSYKLNAPYYCIVLNFGGGDSSNRLHVGRDVSSPAHSGNAAYYVESSTWEANTSYDLFQ